MARNLTDNQRRFLEVLFEEAQGDAVQAKNYQGTERLALLVLL